MNDENLTHKLTVSDQRAGGKASGAARRKKKQLKELVELAFEKVVSHDQDGRPITADEAMVMKQLQNALNGDTKAFVVLRDTAGQMPVQRIETTEISQEVYDRVERALKGDI